MLKPMWVNDPGECAKADVMNRQGSWPAIAGISINISVTWLERFCSIQTITQIPISALVTTVWVAGAAMDDCRQPEAGAGWLNHRSLPPR